jgi:acyl carrier protein
MLQLKDDFNKYTDCTTIKELVSQIVSMELGHVPSDDSNFAELGMNSLRLINVLSELVRVLELPMSIMVLINYNTIELLSNRITVLLYIKNHTGNNDGTEYEF